MVLLSVRVIIIKFRNGSSTEDGGVLCAFARTFTWILCLFKMVCLLNFTFSCSSHVLMVLIQFVPIHFSFLSNNS